MGFFQTIRGKITLSRNPFVSCIIWPFEERGLEGFNRFSKGLLKGIGNPKKKKKNNQEERKSI